MKPYYQDNHIQIFNRDCRSMDELADECVQCVITSPPYWGLRKYAGLPDLVWRDNNCEHKFGSELKVIRHRAGETNPGKEGYTKDAGAWSESAGNFCSLCGAWKGSYGLEPTPEMYIEHTIEILREIRRVLRKDGVVFLNLGDSYAGGKGTCFNPGGGKGSFSTHGDRKDAGIYPLDRGNVSMLRASGLKPKDLCLIPFRVAISAQMDGWWVRSVIIWSKPNPMPESVTDRPTESHEYILMLTKSARYYWDADAVREPFLTPEDDKSNHTFGAPGGKAEAVYGSKHLTSGKTWKPKRGYKTKVNQGSLNTEQHHGQDIFPQSGGRNIRTVWEFPTQPYPEAHFAVFPEKLPETCIKAASKEGDLILDPFAGAGTTLWVAKTLGRKAVGYELSEEYCQLSVERNRQQALDFNIAERR